MLSDNDPVNLPSPAVEDPPTREALRAYRRRALRTLGLGLAALIIAAIAVQPNNGNPPAILSAVGIGGFGIGGVAVWAGGLGTLRTLRISHGMKHDGWVVRQADYRIAPIGANGQPALLVHEDSHGPEAVCSVSTTVWRYRRLPQGPDLPFLFLGNPRRWAVMAPPDRSILVVVKRPVLPFWSHFLRKYATEARP